MHTYDIFEGPTSFSPIIEMATTIVEQSGGQYHVLVIIADGQVRHHFAPFVFLFLGQVFLILLYYFACI
jgi:hypothetical protein